MRIRLDNNGLCPNCQLPLLADFNGGSIIISCSCGYRLKYPWTDKAALIAKALNHKPTSSLGAQISLLTGRAPGGQQIPFNALKSNSRGLEIERNGNLPVEAKDV